MPDLKTFLDNEFDLFEPIHLAQNLVRISSVSRTRGESDIARHIANYFIDHQIRVEWQEVEEGWANIIAEIDGGKGEGQSLLLNGHLDTVPVGTGWTMPPLGGQVVENYLYGRGSCDMKGSLAAMMYTAKIVSLFAPSLYGKLKLVFVVDEEQDNLGIKKWIENRQKNWETVDFAVVGEPTGLNISLGHRGVAAFRVTMKGKSCHAGIANRGINAIYLASEAVRLIEEKKPFFDEYEDPDIGKPALSVGKIQGGTSPNVVPDHCSFEVDVRTVPGLSLQEMENIIRDTVTSVFKNHNLSPTFDIEQSIPHLPPVKIPRDVPGIEILSRSISDIPGEMPIFAPFPASCEATFLDQAGIPTVIFGPGRIEEAHGANEFVSITQIVAASRIYSLLALRFLGGE